MPSRMACLRDVRIMLYEKLVVNSYTFSPKSPSSIEAGNDIFAAYLTASVYVLYVHAINEFFKEIYQHTVAIDYMDVPIMVAEFCERDALYFLTDFPEAFNRLGISLLVFAACVKCHFHRGKIIMPSRSWLGGLMI